MMRTDEQVEVGTEIKHWLAEGRCSVVRVGGAGGQECPMSEATMVHSPGGHAFMCGAPWNSGRIGQCRGTASGYLTGPW